MANGIIGAAMDSAKMNSDISGYWGGSKAGDTGAWGAGKITRNADGSATYTDSKGTNYGLNSTMDAAQLASISPEIANILKANYGFTAPPVQMPAQSASAPSSPASNNAHMYNDISNYWNVSKAGDSQAWGAGQLQRNADNSATYTDATGRQYRLDSTMDAAQLARMNPEIANTLKTNYGFSNPTGYSPQQLPSSFTAPPTTQAINTAGYSATQAASPTQWKVDQNQTAHGLLTKYLDPSNPIIQQAMGQAAMAANARGLQNSSMAAQGGMEAAYNAMVPIANADAATYAKAAAYNADAANQVNLKNAELGSSLTQAQLGADISQRNTDAGNATGIYTNEMSNRQSAANTAATIEGNLKSAIAQSQLSNDNKIALQNLADQHQLTLTTNQSATTLFQQATTNITNIQNSSLDANAKMTAINNQYEILKGSLAMLSSISGIPDLDKLVNFDAKNSVPAEGLNIPSLDSLGKTNWNNGSTYGTTDAGGP